MHQRFAPAARWAGPSPAAIALLVVLTLALTTGVASAAPGGGVDLPPDLRPAAPELFLLARDAAGPYEVRFDTEAINLGAGVLELDPEPQDCDGDGDRTNDRSVYQRVFQDSDGDGVFTRHVDRDFTTRFAGCTRFHPEHDHWHFESFARYELRAEPTGEVVSRASKVSFCITDSMRAPVALPGTPASPYFTRCSRSSPQGISVGWSDLYDFTTPGQSLSVRGLTPGLYCFSTTVDPDDRLVEKDETNNEVQVQLVFDGNQMARTGLPCVSGGGHLGSTSA